MIRDHRLAAAVLAATCFWVSNQCLADADYKVVTIITATTLDDARDAAPTDSVSDQPIKHVVSAEGRDR